MWFNCLLWGFIGVTCTTFFPSSLTLHEGHSYGIFFNYSCGIEKEIFFGLGWVLGLLGFILFCYKVICLERDRWFESFQILVLVSRESGQSLEWSGLMLNYNSPVWRFSTQCMFGDLMIILGSVKLWSVAIWNWICSSLLFDLHSRLICINSVAII